VGAGLAGLLVDVLYARLRPTATTPTAWRLFAFALPATFYLCCFRRLVAQLPPGAQDRETCGEWVGHVHGTS